MRVHQGKSQDYHMIVLQDDIDTVHSGNEIVFTEKQRIDGVPVGAEVPAVPDFDFLLRNIRNSF